MDNLSLAKKELKIIDMCHGNKIRKGKYTFVNPCPMCGHKDHFIILDNNEWYSEARCCSPAGGTVIDFLMAYKGMTSKEAINYTLVETGMNIKISPNQIKKIKADNERKQKRNTKENFIIRECYHKLCRMLRALNNIKDKSHFLIWLESFLDRYTDRYVKASSHKELIDLCYGFKDELSMEYDNFISYEKYLLEVKK